MKHKIKLIIGSAIALALFTGTAQAALVLSGNTAGYFQEVTVGTTVITNAPDGSTASIFTGGPIPGSFKSGVVFNGSDFSNIVSGDTFALGSITYYNGRTLIGTSSDTAVLDFYINLSDPSVQQYLLTSISFGIDATVNTAEGTNPDFYTATFTQPAPILINGTMVQFTINDLPGSTIVLEDTWTTIADVTVTFFSPVPEPSTYGLIGAAGLMGLVGYRRFQAKRLVGTDAAA